MAVGKQALTPYILAMANNHPRTNTFHDGKISRSWWTGFFIALFVFFLRFLALKCRTFNIKIEFIYEYS